MLERERNGLGFGAHALKIQAQNDGILDLHTQIHGSDCFLSSALLRRSSAPMDSRRAHPQSTPHSHAHADTATHYDVLNVAPSSTLEEIRTGYRAALLSAHPDKLGPRSLPPSAQASLHDASRYLRVQEAWSVLRDAESRAVYDGLVKASRAGGKGDASVVVGEEVALEDMEECVSETLGLEYWYPCRCSDFFVVDVQELQEVGLGFKDKNSGGAVVDEEVGVSTGEEHGDCGGVDRGTQRQSIVLPCGSCSLHLRVHFWVPCP